MSAITLMIGIMMISIGMIIEKENQRVDFNKIEIQEIDVKNMATSATRFVEDEKEESKEETNDLLTAVVMETAPASVIIPPRVEVFEGMTLEELTEKLNRNLGGILAGHGDIIASYSIEKGENPYLVAAIMIHETGNGKSRIANECYNFGGQKGSGCGMYKKYDTVEAGLKGIMDNLYRNYYAYGLTTVESIGSKYAESKDWPNKIHYFMNKIRNN